MNDGLIQQCIDTLGCKRESFPQNYLGLPLSAHKLPNLVFSTYIERIEKSLSSWQASLLNTMGRVVLINSVLDSKLIYVMSSMQLPPGLLQQVDKLRRAFLWAGDQNTSSSKCLVALQNVCTTKELGGLGIKDLGTHNICLLLKLIHRLHCANYSAWATWIRQRANLASLKGDLRGHHWEMLRTLLPLYQAITTVSLGNGKSTSFWNDVWVGDDALADRFPALFSHGTQKEASVSMAITSNLQNAFVSRMTAQAAAELGQVHMLIQQTTLQEAS